MSDYITISPIGSRNGVTTAFRTVDGVRVKCGCFYGSIAEFEKQVRETHGDNQYAKEYLALAELLKVRFGEKLTVRKFLRILFEKIKKGSNCDGV